MMNYKSKVAIVIFEIIFLFSTISYADDPYYLLAELAETRRHYEAVNLDKVKAELFLENYGKTFEELKNAYHELNDLKKRVSSILKKNLIKSILRLGLDTIDQIQTCTDLAGKTVKKIILTLGTEAVINVAQDSYTSPYSVAVGKLSEQATKTYPELKRINEIIRMNSIDIKFEMLKSGEDPSSLGETGIIYRKLVMILEATEDAQKKLYELRKDLDKTKAEVLASMPKLIEQEERLRKRIEELTERYNKLPSKGNIVELEKQQLEAENIASVVNKIKPKPVFVENKEKQEELKASLLVQLKSIISKKRFESSEIWGTIRDKELGSYFDVKILPKTEYEIKTISVDDLRVFINIGPNMIKDYEKVISIAKDYIEKYSNLIKATEAEITSILEQLAGLGDTEGRKLAYDFFKEVGGYIAKLKNFCNVMEKNIEVLNENLSNYKKEFSKRLDMASLYQSNFVTDAENVLNAAVDTVSKAENTLKAAADIGIKVDTPGYLEIRIIPEMKNEVKKMFNGGATTNEVKKYINKKKEEILKVYDLATKAINAERIRNNMVNELDAKYPDINTIYLEFREDGLRDVYKEFNDKYTEYITSSKHIDNMTKINSLSKELFKIGDTLNDLLIVVNKIEDINRKLVNVFEKEGYSKGMDKKAESKCSRSKRRSFNNISKPNCSFIRYS